MMPSLQGGCQFTTVWNTVSFLWRTFLLYEHHCLEQSEPGGATGSHQLQQSSQRRQTWQRDSWTPENSDGSCRTSPSRTPGPCAVCVHGHCKADFCGLEGSIERSWHFPEEECLEEVLRNDQLLVLLGEWSLCLQQGRPPLTDAENLHSVSPQPNFTTQPMHFYVYRIM